MTQTEINQQEPNQTIQEPQATDQTEEIKNLKPLNDNLFLEEYAGEKTTINKIEIKELPDTKSLTGTKKVLKISTLPITQITTNTETGQTQIPIPATELFSLIENKDGIGWTPNSNLAKLLTKHKAEHPTQLIGKTVIIRIRQKEGDDKKYLGFYIT